MPEFILPKDRPSVPRFEIHPGRDQAGIGAARKKLVTDLKPIIHEARRADDAHYRGGVEVSVISTTRHYFSLLVKLNEHTSLHLRFWDHHGFFEPTWSLSYSRGGTLDDIGAYPPKMGYGTGVNLEVGRILRAVVAHLATLTLVEIPQ